MSDGEMLQKIVAILNELKPNIQMDGGDIEFVKFQDGIVYIRFMGACIGCPMSAYTLKMGIEQSLKEHIPDVVEVIAVDNADNNEID